MIAPRPATLVLITRPDDGPTTFTFERQRASDLDRARLSTIGHGRANRLHQAREPVGTRNQDQARHDAIQNERKSGFIHTKIGS